MVNKAKAKELSKNLVVKEVRELYDIIDGVGHCVSIEAYNEQFDKLEKAYAAAKATGKLTPADDVEIQEKIKEEELKLAFLKEDDEDVLNQVK